MFVTKTVRELIFEGYEDPILNDTKFLPSSLVPQKIDRFGYFYQVGIRNQSLVPVRFPDFLIQIVT